MKSDILFRLVLVMAWAFVSLIAQIIMQRAAVSTRDLDFSQNIGKFILAFVKIGVASSASLLMTFFCYRSMSFTEFLFSQSIFYIFAFIYAFTVLNETFSLWKFFAVMCFIPGLIIALGNK